MKHDWEYKKIKDVCTKGSSNLQQNKIVELTGSYPVFGASGFVQYIDTYQQEKPYIGIVKDGSGVGRVNTYPAKSSLLGTMQYIIPNDNINLGYVAYCLQSLKLAIFASGAAIPHIYFRDYGETYIPVPPLSVQEQICSLLDKMNRVIEAKKEQLKELDNLAQAIFYDMFGDPVENNREWKTQALGDVCTLKAGKSIKASELSETMNVGLFPCYGGNGVRGYIGRYSHNHPLPIIGRQGALCGNVNFARAPFYATEHAVVVTPKTTMEVVWLFFVLKLMHLNQYAHGVAQPGLSVQDIEPLPLIIPPLPLQQAFAEKVEAIKRQKELINQSIKDVQTLFDAKMDYYFGD